MRIERAIDAFLDWRRPFAPDATQLYTDEIQLDELAQSLARALLARNAQASPDLATLESDVAAALQSLEWRRRESNPRPRTHRNERLQA